MPYRHEALFFALPDALLEATVPWLRDGLHAGEVIALACGAQYNAVLAATLGQHPAVRVLPQDRVYRKAVDAVAFYHDLVTTAIASDNTRVRVLGEVGFGTSARGQEEWLRYEAVCNHALAPLPLWSVCAYYTPELPQSLVDAARATHPWLRTVDGSARNHDYVPPARLLDGTSSPLPDPNRDATTVTLADNSELHRLRRWLRARLDEMHPSVETAESLVLAVDEVAANGLRHGRPPVEVILWLTPTHILCDVTDRGTGISDPLAGYTPPDPAGLAEHGAGLWVTRRLCDELTTAWSHTGFTVRLALSRGESGPDTTPASRNRGH